MPSPLCSRKNLVLIELRSADWHVANGLNNLALACNLQDQVKADLEAVYERCTPPILKSGTLGSAVSDEHGVATLLKLNLLSPVRTETMANRIQVDIVGI